MFSRITVDHVLPARFARHSVPRSFPHPYCIRFSFVVCDAKIMLCSVRSCYWHVLRRVIVTMKKYIIYYCACFALGSVYSLFYLTILSLQDVAIAQSIENLISSAQSIGGDYAIFIPICAFSAFCILKKFKLHYIKNRISIIKTVLLLITGVFIGVIAAFFTECIICIYWLYDFSLQDYPH